MEYNFLIYQVTNIMNGKTYTGKHKTKNINDGYMGSGRLIRQAIKIYGRENFVKAILFRCNSEEEMNSKEIEIVNERLVNTNRTYNMRVGGVGGFTDLDRVKAREALEKSGNFYRPPKDQPGLFRSGEKRTAEIGRKGGLANKGKPKSQAHINANKLSWELKRNITKNNSIIVRTLHGDDQQLF